MCHLGKPAPPAAGETSEAVADKPERLCRPDKPAPPAAGETSAAVADKSEQPREQGKLTPPAAGETKFRHLSFCQAQKFYATIFQSA